MRRFGLLVLLWFSLVAPVSSSADSVVNSFLTSSSGTATIEISDTIQFEVTITTTPGRNYDTIFWSLTSDAPVCVFCMPAAPWSPLRNEVVGWAWHYTPAGGGGVKMGTNGRFVPLAPTHPVPGQLVGPLGFFGVSATGDGVPALVGTVTIHADALGGFTGGGYQYPGVDGFFGSAGGGVVAVLGGDFTVVPEPGTGALVGLAMAGMAVVARRGLAGADRS